MFHAFVNFASRTSLTAAPRCSCLEQTVRSKHSATQIKRIFNKHPARARVEERLASLEQDKGDYAVTPLARTYPAIFQPEFLPNGWSAPPPQGSINVDELYPFQILRTKNKPNDAIGFLPVYSKMRKDGTKTVTRIKKVKGDQTAFLREMRSVLELPEPKNAREDPVRIRVGGTIEIEGNRVRDVKRWLAELGF